MMKYLLFVLGITLLAFTGCKREDIPYIGPSVCPSSNFEVTSNLTISSADINFMTTPKVKITASLSESIDWTLTIVGDVSGAVKEFKGAGSSINLDWYGEPSGAIFFSNEDCQMTLSIACLGVKQSVPFKINTTSNFSKLGYVLWNFDSTAPLTVYGISATVGTFSHGQYNLPGKPALISPSPQGGGYFNFKGDVKSGGAPIWYFGSLNANGNLNPDTLVARTSKDPSRVYYNCYINTNGKSLSQIFFTFNEGAFSRTKAFDGNFSGWKFVSFKLSDIGVSDVSQISEMSVAFQASPTQASSVEVNLDLAIFTLDHPLIQE
jgi:hypothetical protein